MSKRSKIVYTWTKQEGEDRINWALVGANGEPICFTRQGFRDLNDARRSVVAASVSLDDAICGSGFLGTGFDQDGTDVRTMNEEGPGPKPTSSPATLAENRRHETGFSLIEILVVIAIVGILITVSVPSVGRFVANYRTTTLANDFLQSVLATRSRALARGGRFYMAPTDGQWANGWSVFWDRNDNRVFDDPAKGGPDELAQQRGPVGHGQTITNADGSTDEAFMDNAPVPRAYVLFDGLGYSKKRDGGVGVGGVIITSTVGRFSSSKTVCVPLIGRPRVSETGSCK